MRLFPSSSESPHPSETRNSFSEAFLDSSSVRDSLPEQYRAHFDELRSGILAFCHEFDIPVDTLRNKEDFGKQLASKKIPSERMAQAVSLFARLEHLITNKEPLKETLPEYLEEAERLYYLKEQYDAQVSLLEQVGILKDGAILGIDGKEYPIPTLEQIAARLFEREKDLSIKRDQRFTKLLLVPFGMSLDVLVSVFRKFLRDYKREHPDFNLDTSLPLYTWEDGYKGADTEDPPKIFYYPTSFDPDNHQGQTKREILKAQAENPKDSFPGWIIHLFQPSNIQDLDLDSPKGIASIPRQGQGQIQGKEIPRPFFEAGKFSIDYLSLLQEAKDDPTSPYFQESGMTPEDWLCAFMMHLQETGGPLDDHGGNKESITYLTGAFFPSINSSAVVPYAYWSRDIGWAGLNGYNPHALDKNIGFRSSVII